MSNQNHITALLHCATSHTSRVCALRRGVRTAPQIDPTRGRCLHNEVGNYCVAPRRSDRRSATD